LDRAGSGQAQEVLDYRLALETGGLMEVTMDHMGRSILGK
jgi:hypothetical protein